MVVVASWRWVPLLWVVALLWRIGPLLMIAHRRLGRVVSGLGRGSVALVVLLLVVAVAVVSGGGRLGPARIGRGVVKLGGHLVVRGTLAEGFGGVERPTRLTATVKLFEVCSGQVTVRRWARGEDGVRQLGRLTSPGDGWRSLGGGSKDDDCASADGIAPQAGGVVSVLVGVSD